MSARGALVAKSIRRSGPRSRSAPVLEKSIRSEMPKAQSPLSLQYHSWTQADEYSANIHPRWLEFKEAGNEALKRGDYHAALRLYSEAVAMCDGRLAVGAFFDALNGHPAQSAAQRLAGMRADIMPLIKDCMLCPDLEKGQPNMPAAVCAANRAAAAGGVEAMKKPAMGSNAAVAAANPAPKKWMGKGPPPPGWNKVRSLPPPPLLPPPPAPVISGDLVLNAQAISRDLPRSPPATSRDLPPRSPAISPAARGDLAR